MSIQTLKKTPKPLILLKQIQNEHFVDLQKKHLSDTDLIEDIRQFCKQKAGADREYAQSMQKIIQNLLAKRHFPVKEISKDELTEDLNVWNTWRGLLKQYENSANLRLNTAELLQKLSDQLKPIRVNRLSTNKRILDQLKLLQTDLYSCVQEMIKAQKVYSEEEKQAHEIRIKAQDAAAKVKNKSTNLFNSMANLHKNSNKLSSRLDAYQTRSTAARNEYLFQLAAINAHLFSYFHVDLGDYAQIIDADIYERFKELLVTITTDEQNCSIQQNQVWLKLIKTSEKICRKYHWDVFLKTYPSFNTPIQYNFQPVKGDKIHLLVPLNTKENTLANVTKKLVKRLIVREHKIMGYEKEVKSFETGRVTPIQSATLSPAADSEVGVDDLISYNQEYVEHKVEELKFAIRKEKIEKNKIEACLSLLKDSGVETDKILDEARTTVAAATEMMKQNNRSPEIGYPSQSISIEINQSIDNPDFDEELSQINNDDLYPYSLSKYSGYEYQSGSGCSTPNKQQSHGSTITKSSDSPESINNIKFASNTNINNEEHTSVNYEDDWVGDGGYGRAVAIFEFQASIGQWDELDLVVNEEVILLNEFETDGWIKVRSLIDGREGMVPMNYLRIIQSNIPQINSNENEIKNDYENIADYVNVLQVSGNKPIQCNSEINKPVDGDDLVKTAYSFSSTNSDELQLEKNDIIRVISRVSQDGVDDGWWEGYKVTWDESKNNWIIIQRGFFPSMVVRKYVLNNQPKADQSPICPRIEPRKRPKVKLDFEKIKSLKNSSEVVDNTSSETDVVGDYVRLASENEQKTDEIDLNLEIKEL